MTDDLEMLARTNAGAEVLKIIAKYGDKGAGEIFRGYIHAFAHGLHAVTPGRHDAAELLYRLADDHAVMPVVTITK